MVFQCALRLVASPVQKRSRVRRTGSDMGGFPTAGSVGLSHRHVHRHRSMTVFGNLVKGSSSVLSVSSPVQSRKGQGYAARVPIWVAALLQVPLDYLTDTAAISGRDPVVSSLPGGPPWCSPSSFQFSPPVQSGKVKDMPHGF